MLPLLAALSTLAGVGSAGCHLIFPFDAPGEVSADAAADVDRRDHGATPDLEAPEAAPLDQAAPDTTPACPPAQASYTPQRSNTQGCPGKQACQLWDGLCLDLNHQYVALRHDTQTGELRTYGLCNVDAAQGVLRCMSGDQSVLRIVNAGVDTLTGADDFTGRWTLLHREMSAQPSATHAGCTAATCELFSGSAVDDNPTVRLHLRRTEGNAAQWFSWCTVGTHSRTSNFAAYCAALDASSDALKRVTVLRAGDEKSEDGTGLTGQWTLFRVAQTVIRGPTTGCSVTSNTCELWNGFAVNPAAVHAVVQFDSASRQWYQLCSGSKVGAGPAQLRCHHRFPPAAPNPYLTIDAGGDEINMGTNALNATWYLLREP